MRILRVVAVLFVLVGTLIGCESNRPELKSFEFPLKSAKYVSYTNGTYKLRFWALDGALGGGSAECWVPSVDVRVDSQRPGTYVQLYGASWSREYWTGAWNAQGARIIVRTSEQQAEWQRSFNALGAPRDVAPPGPPKE